jgi:S1-C subfamily serine protease
MPRELLTFAAGVLAALTALAIYSALMPASQAVTLRDVNEAVVRAMASATPRPPFSVSVYEAIAPSLVLIQTKGDEPRGGVSLSQDEARGLGSGVIVNERGLILTSLHVVERAKEIQVTFADGTEAPAVIIAEQPENDIAVLAPLRLPAAVVPGHVGQPKRPARGRRSIRRRQSARPARLAERRRDLRPAALVQAGEPQPQAGELDPV